MTPHGEYTTAEIGRWLEDIKGDISEIKKDLREQSTRYAPLSSNNDHETRIRRLERALWIGIGGATTVGSFVGSFIGSLPSK